MKTFKQYLEEESKKFKSVTIIKDDKISGHLTATDKKGLLLAINTGDKFKDKNGNINVKINRKSFFIIPKSDPNIFDVKITWKQKDNNNREVGASVRSIIQFK